MNCLQTIQITDDTENYFAEMAKFTLPLTSQGKRWGVTFHESILRLNFDQKITRFWTVYKLVLVFCQMGMVSKIISFCTINTVTSLVGNKATQNRKEKHKYKVVVSLSLSRI